MKIKTILINNQIYELTLLQIHNKINDEVLPQIRKVGNGADKNHIFINDKYIINSFYGHDFNGGEIEQIDVYFSIDNLITSVDRANNRLKNENSQEPLIDKKNVLDTIIQITIDKGLHSGCVADSCELSRANNGLGFKNWDKTYFFYKNIVKRLYFKDTSLKIYLFKKDGKVCSYWEIFVNDEVNDFSHNKFQIDAFIESLDKSSLVFEKKLVKRFINSLITKPFVILTGLAGSGKTKLAQSFVQWICKDDKQYNIVPVGADWINREPLLGYPNGLKADEYVMPDNGALQLMIEAAKEENQNQPFFLILDEMNLSHVERYFADFLSIMESNDSIKLYTGLERNSTDGEAVPQIVLWPNNLFIIGTVNIDETTYMFSPKVLDRANVIEFRLDEQDLVNFLNRPRSLDINLLISKGADMATNFLNLSKEKESVRNKELNDTLLAFFTELKAIGAEFGYRTAYEINLFLTQFNKIDPSLSNDDKVDFAIMQKLLPKLHGSRSKIVKSLESLMKLCLIESNNFSIAKINEVEGDNVKYKLSFDKLKRMYTNALNNGFTSYAEA